MPLYQLSDSNINIKSKIVANKICCKYYFVKYVSLKKFNI